MARPWSGSPGLVVMGGDSRYEGCGFESEHRMLEGHFFTFICCKNCNVFWKDENKRKEAGDGPFFIRQHQDIVNRV